MITKGFSELLFSNQGFITGAEIQEIESRMYEKTLVKKPSNVSWS
jgi:hypothetical protein